jgi:hypothetical protein
LYGQPPLVEQVWAGTAELEETMLSTAAIMGTVGFIQLFNETPAEWSIVVTCFLYTCGSKKFRDIQKFFCTQISFTVLPFQPNQACRQLTLKIFLAYKTSDRLLLRRRFSH